MTATAPELVALGPCPACGQPRWRAELCRCGHPVTAHLVDGDKRRGCSVAVGEVWCECKRYERSQ